MSWAAHQFEGYIAQRHFGKHVAISYLAIVVGDQAPDFITKYWVYGINLGFAKFGTSNPAQFHRGWPGAGFTHSLLFGVVLAGIVYAFTRNQAWFVGMVIGTSLHVLTDITDTAGTLVLFPLSTENITIGMWKYGAAGGRYRDAAAYYSSLGFVMDAAWFVIALFNWRVLTERYFRTVVRPADPVWGWLGRRMPDIALLALYRAMFFYAGCRVVAWVTWAHAVEHYPWDLRWGGPSFVEGINL